MTKALEGVVEHQPQERHIEGRQDHGAKAAEIPAVLVDENPQSWGVFHCSSLISLDQMLASNIAVPPEIGKKHSVVPRCLRSQ